MTSTSPSRRTSLAGTLSRPCRSIGPAASVLALLLAGAAQAATATFDDLALPPESYWNGAAGEGGFLSGDVFFANDYNSDWDSWSGFAYSNRTDIRIAGMEGQYNAIAGSGQGGSPNYAVAFVGWETPPAVTFPAPQGLSGLYVTNCNYAYDDMLGGSPFSKKFGGQEGDDEDWFKLTITGLDEAGQVTGEVEFYLADLRFADNSLDYILETWAFVDLTSLGIVRTLQFHLDSSDQGLFGMNTPGYFCLDTIVPRTGDLPVAEQEPPVDSDEMAAIPARADNLSSQSSARP